jgi:hypothetical protein
MGYPPVHRDALLIVSDVGSNTQVAAAGVDNKEMPKPDTVSSQLTNIRSLQHQYEPDGEADNEMDIEKGLSDETQPALLQRDSTGSSLPNPPPSQDAPMAGEEPGNTIDVDMDEPDQVPPLFDLSDSPLSEPPSSEEATTPDEEQESEQSNSLLSDADPSHQPPTAPNVFPATDAEKERYINNLRKLCASRMNGRVDKEEIDIPTGYQYVRILRGNPSSRAYDCYLYGHPSHYRYRSATEFFPHLTYLIQKREGREVRCRCKGCGILRRRK